MHCKVNRRMSGSPPNAGYAGVQKRMRKGTHSCTACKWSTPPDRCLQSPSLLCALIVSSNGAGRGSANRSLKVVGGRPGASFLLKTRRPLLSALGGSGNAYLKALSMRKSTLLAANE